MQQLDERITSQLLREQQIDLRQYGNILARRKWLIILLTGIVTAVVTVIVFLLPPIYRSTATVMIESQEANVIPIQNIYDSDTRALEYYQTQFEILKSRPLAEAVVRKLVLTAFPDFSPAQPLIPYAWRLQWAQQLNRWQILPQQLKQWLFLWAEDGSAPVDPDAAAVDKYLAHLQIQPKAKTQLVSVSFDAHDAELAARVANAHAQAFIESHMNAKETMTRTAAEWMAGRLEDLRQKLTIAEKNLQQFKEREQLVDIDGMNALPAQELTELTTKLIEARRSLSESRNTYQQISAARSEGLNEKLSIPTVASDELVQKFKQAVGEAEAQVAELARRYGPQHPKMKAAISQREAAIEQLSRQVDSVMDSTKNRYDVLRDQEQAIATAMNSTKTHVNVVGRKEAEYRELQREVEANRQLYELFYKRISETAETGNLATPNARVIEPAIASMTPFKPQRGLIIGMGFLVSLMFGIMLAFLLEALNNTVRHGNDVIEKIQVPLLGLIPLLRLKKRVRLIGHKFLDRNEPEFCEAIRTLRTGVNLSGLDKSMKTLMVISSVTGEGKTSVASNLALAFAQIERVLLIDTDMRRPTLAQEFQIPRSQPGLAALCAGIADAGECIVRGVSANLDVLIAGEIPPNPQELLASQKFRALVNKLSERYDRIIFDCPPVLPVSDALLLANVVSAAIYVVRAEKTPVAQIRRGIEQLHRARIEVLGVALNAVDSRKISAYGEYGGAYMSTGYLVAGAH